MNLLDADLAAALRNAPIEPGGARVTPAPRITYAECARRFADSYSGRAVAEAMATAKAFADLRAARVARVDNGTECARCGSLEMETHDATGVFLCLRCGEAAIDLRSAR